MDAHAEQRLAGWIVGGSALLLAALGAWIARSGNTRWINGVDFSRIDPRDHPRAARIVGETVIGIAVVQLGLAGWLVAAPGPIRAEWLVVLVAILPAFALLAVMYLRLQGLYRR